MSRALAVVSPDAHEDDDSVLRLFEDPDIHTSPESCTTDVDIMTDPSAGSAPLADEMRSVAGQHDAVSRAAAALQQADAAAGNLHRQRSHDLDDATLHQHGQVLQHPQRQFSGSPAAVPIDMQSLGTLSSRVSMSSGSEAALPTTSAGNGSVPVTTAAPAMALPAISPPSICLCQVPARIPRPRNAFILFRQHHHAAVVAKNPGKTNPEISKIIGQMWKESAEDVKAVWQGHADEEKRQHLARYPQYRYQPRRNSKKNAAAVAAAARTADTLSPSIEAAVCPNCGGRTGALSAPHSSAAPAASTGRRAPTHPPSSRTQPAGRKKAPTPDDARSQHTTTSETLAAGGVDQAGVEALLQLGGLHADDDHLASAELDAPSKRRKLTEDSPELSTTTLLQHHALYSTHGPDPTIDPYLRHPSFDHDSPSALLEHEPAAPGMQAAPLSFPAHLFPDASIIKTIPVLSKIHAIASICPPIPGSVSHFDMSAPRLPVVCIEGEHTEAVADLFHSLSRELEKSQPVLLFDEADDFVTDPYWEHLTDLHRDRDVDDAESARYLEHVAVWRRNSADMRKAVYGLPILPRARAHHTQAQAGAAPEDLAGGRVHAQAQTHVQSQAQGQVHGHASLVLINRYILSRAEMAAQRLALDGLTPYRHWQWCTSVWKGCVGADVTIFVQAMSEGAAHIAGGDDAVESRDGGKVLVVRKMPGSKEWEEKVIRRLGFEVGEVVRNLKGFVDP